MRTYATKSFAGRDFMVVDPPSIGFTGHDNACFDQDEPTRHIVAELKPGQVFVDVGAHFGAYALAALAMGAYVHAFEPSKVGHAVLRSNVTINSWSAKCFVHKLVLWDDTPYPDALAGEVFTEHYPTPTFQLGTLDSQVANVHMMKIDVEGAELGVLLGGVKTLERWKPTLIIEDHEDIDPPGRTQVCDYPKSIDSSARIHALLARLGYGVEVVRWDVSRKFIVARPA